MSTAGVAVWAGGGAALGAPQAAAAVSTASEEGGPAGSGARGGGPALPAAAGSLALGSVPASWPQAATGILEVGIPLVTWGHRKGQEPRPLEAPWAGH